MGRAMSEIIAPCASNYPHVNRASSGAARQFRIAHAQGMVVGPTGWAQAVASIGARRMGKERFDLRANRSQSRRDCFLRQTVWAHLHFGFRDELAFTEIAAFSGHDHTTVIHGIRALYCRIEHEPKTSRLFDDICADVKKEWPGAQSIRARMKEWTGWS